MIALSVVGLYRYLGAEQYFFVWPSIDTRYSKDYNEEKFNQITVGMSIDDVEELIGQPLRIYHHGWNNSNEMTYSYSSDNRFKFADFAWLGREIVFKDDKVIEIRKEIYYD